MSGAGVDLATARRAQVLHDARERPKACSSCLHVVLDDGNDSDLFCEKSLAEARALGHVDCVELAEIVLRMTRTQRKKLAGGGYR